MIESTKDTKTESMHERRAVMTDRIVLQMRCAVCKCVIGVRAVDKEIQQVPKGPLTEPLYLIEPCKLCKKVQTRLNNAAPEMFELCKSFAALIGSSESFDAWVSIVAGHLYEAQALIAKIEEKEQESADG